MEGSWASPLSTVLRSCKIVVKKSPRSKLRCICLWNIKRRDSFSIKKKSTFVKRRRVRGKKWKDWIKKFCACFIYTYMCFTAAAAFFLHNTSSYIQQHWHDWNVHKRLLSCWMDACTMWWDEEGWRDERGRKSMNSLIFLFLCQICCLWWWSVVRVVWKRNTRQSSSSSPKTERNLIWNSMPYTIYMLCCWCLSLRLFSLCMLTWAPIQFFYSLLMLGEEETENKKNQHKYRTPSILHNTKSRRMAQKRVEEEKRRFRLRNVWLAWWDGFKGSIDDDSWCSGTIKTFYVKRCDHHLPLRMSKMSFRSKLPTHAGLLVFQLLFRCRRCAQQFVFFFYFFSPFLSASRFADRLLLGCLSMDMRFF